MRRIVCERHAGTWAKTYPGEPRCMVVVGRLKLRPAPEPTTVYTSEHPEGVVQREWQPDEYACDDCSEALKPGDRVACVSAGAAAPGWELEYLVVE